MNYLDFKSERKFKQNEFEVHNYKIYIEKDEFEI